MNFFGIPQYLFERLPAGPAGSRKWRGGRPARKGVNRMRRMRRREQAARREHNKRRPQHRQLSVKPKRMRKLIEQHQKRQA